jgi:hypothetical protein
MPDNRPHLIEKIDLNAPIDVLRRTLVAGTDALLRLRITRGPSPENTTGASIELHLSGDDDGTPWAQTCAGEAEDEASGWWKIEIPAAKLNLVGDIDGQILLTDANTKESCSQLLRLKVVEKLTGGSTPPSGSEINWSEYTGYANTATHGPVRPGTGISNTVNADGSNTHSVAYGSTAGTALEGNGTAADVDPAGTAIAAALGGKMAQYNIVNWWNASTNSPALADGTGTEGQVLQVSGIPGETYSVDTGDGAKTYSPFGFVVYRSGKWGPETSAVINAARFGMFSSYLQSAANPWTTALLPTAWPAGLRQFRVLGDGIANGFPANRGTIVTIGDGTEKTQLFIANGTDNAAYIRTHVVSSNAWQAWKKLTADGDNILTGILRALGAGGLALQDSAGTTHATVASTGVALNQLTASRPLALDASKNVTSPTAADFRATIGAGFVDYILGHYPKPAASALDWLLLNRAIRIPSVSPGVAFCRTAAAAETTFNIRKNGSNIGTVVFAAAGTVGTVTVTSNTDFAAGDRLELLAPATPDADLSDMQLSLKGIIL